MEQIYYTNTQSWYWTSKLWNSEQLSCGSDDSTSLKTTLETESDFSHYVKRLGPLPCTRPQMELGCQVSTLCAWAMLMASVVSSKQNTSNPRTYNLVQRNWAMSAAEGCKRHCWIKFHFIFTNNWLITTSKFTAVTQTWRELWETLSTAGGIQNQFIH